MADLDVDRAYAQTVLLETEALDADRTYAQVALITTPKMDVDRVYVQTIVVAATTVISGDELDTLFFGCNI